MTKLEYPVARRDETIVEKYHGVEVSTHFPLIDFKGYVKFSLSLSLSLSFLSFSPLQLCQFFALRKILIYFNVGSFIQERFR